MGPLNDVDSTLPDDADEASAVPASAPVDRRRPTLALLEIIDRDGHVRQAWRVRAWPATVGRSLDNDIVLTDPHVAAHHFRLEPTAEGLAVHVDDATVNGVTIEHRRIDAGATALLRADAEEIDVIAGRTRLRLRVADAALAPERPLSAILVRPLALLPTLGLALLLLAGVSFNAYLDADPDNLVRVAGNALVVALTAAAVWCGAWSLLSKTITRQAHVSWHLRVFVTAALALLALEPARPKVLRAVVATGAVVGIALTLWYNEQRTSRIGDELYMSHLFPPALRLAKPLATDRFIEGLAPLHALLDKKAKEPARDDPFGGGQNRGEDDD